MDGMTMLRWSLMAVLLGIFITAPAQTGPLRARPVPMPKPAQAVPDPATPPAQTVEDERTHLHFRLPAGWNLTRVDRERSTFHLDARTALPRTEMRAVADLDFNPYPRSTFSGALFYLSVTPHSTAVACAAQASARPAHAQGTATVGDVLFNRGHDEHGKICTEARDEIYTALRVGSCIRFDLAMNSFCGGEVSGAQDLTQAQIDAIEARMQSILSTVQFTSRK